MQKWNVPVWIWPSQARDESSAVVRLGRVLHWILTACAALLVGAAFESSSEVLFFLAFAGVVFFTGRGCRYILSNE